ncbi:MAG: glycine--tRNA ligase [Candidatus Electryonea clarkiae]|nr:glycine--tRNA ligase [Candidatus Electryonea clarkiae]MDP8285227.1 glycine--tRNA ligase [Candidatus Electryonea clarkiae]
MAAKNKERNPMEVITALAKRRGFVMPTSEIYGGIGSSYDYGPLGIEMKRKIADLWWKEMVRKHENIVGIDSSIIYHPRTWEASGHVDGFVDSMVDCKKCKSRFKAEDLVEHVKKAKGLNELPLTPDGENLDPDNPGYAQLPCPKCGNRDTLTEPRNFNLMFKTHVGPLEEAADKVFLRPETAQGIYVDYPQVQTVSRLRPPFGIAQIGKAFRNEITPGNFIFRTREFEQMEMQYFVKPGDEDEAMEYWKEERLGFWRDVIGIQGDNLRLREHGPTELAHYAKAAWDIEYKFHFGFSEIEGVHNRTDYDLKRHAEFSGREKDLQYFDDQTRERYLPYIVETSAGLNRGMLATLLDAYCEDEVDGQTRVVLKLDPKVAPTTAAIFPLTKKDGLPEIARKIYDDLKLDFNVFYDQQGNIGRRYRRQDEAGTPFCFTVDHQTLEDNTVTIRDRDTLDQPERPKIDALPGILAEKLRN